MRKTPRNLLPLVTCCVLACTVSGSREQDDGFIGPFDSGTSATGSASGGSSGSNGDASGESGAEEDGEGTIKLDVAPAVGTAAGDGGGAAGCDKVDFVFVVDHSGSMTAEVQNLAQSFPGFIEAIQNSLVDNAWRVMVVDAAPSDLTSCRETCDNCPDGGFCVCSTVHCDDFPPYDACEERWGRGRRLGADLGECGLPSGVRFMSHETPNPDEVFECIVAVGNAFGSDDELVADALLQSLDEDLTGAGGCNEGFLRDDAILVVTFVTDEEDGAGDSPGDPEQWYETLVELKHGNADAIVMLGVFGDPDVPGGVCMLADPDGTSSEGAEASPRLRRFVELFGERGIAGSVCLPDYAEFFLHAVSTIDTTCDEFVPVG